MTLLTVSLLGHPVSGHPAWLFLAMGGRPPLGPCTQWPASWWVWCPSCLTRACVVYSLRQLFSVCIHGCVSVCGHVGAAAGLAEGRVSGSYLTCCPGPEGLPGTTSLLGQVPRWCSRAGLIGLCRKAWSAQPEPRLGCGTAGWSGGGNREGPVVCAAHRDPVSMWPWCRQSPISRRHPESLQCRP